MRTPRPRRAQADCALYLETGVSFPRHPAGARSGTGIEGKDTAAGLRVETVHPESSGARLGLEPGDLLVEMGGAPLFGKRELLFFMREHKPGERVEAALVRDRQLCRAGAELDPWRPLSILAVGTIDSRTDV